MQIKEATQDDPLSKSLPLLHIGEIFFDETLF
jgi:hypothetical protein